MELVTFPPRELRAKATHPAIAWHKLTGAIILAHHACEDHLAGIGIPRAQARVLARAIVRTFTTNLAARREPMSEIHEASEAFLQVCEHAAEQAKNGGVA